MISMLQLLPAAISFPCSSHSMTRYKALCTVHNHAYENRKKMLRNKYQTQHANKKDVYGKH
jgi:hypothetical protein